LLRFIVLVLGSAAATLAIRWLMRSAHAEAPTTAPHLEGFTMRPSAAHRRFLLSIFTLTVLGIATMFWYVMPYWKLGVAFAPFFLFPVLLALNSLRRTVAVSTSGLVSHSPWTGSKTALWDQIESVRFREWGQTIRIRLKGGGLIVIPCYMAGTEALEVQMRKDLEPAVIGDTFDRYREYLAAL